MPIISKRPKILTVVRGIITNDEGKILIVKRSNKRGYNIGKWELPGGKIRTEETMVDSLTNIIDTEVGIIVDVRPELFHSQSRLVTEKGKYKDYLYIEMTTPAKFVSGKVEIKSKEHSKFAWVDPDQVFDYELSKESKKILNFLREGTNKRNTFKKQSSFCSKSAH